MAVGRETHYDLKRHHIKLWRMQWLQLADRPPFRTFLRSKLEERGANADDAINVDGRPAQIMELIEGDIDSYA